MRKTVFETIFSKLSKLGLDINNLPDSAKLKSGAYMDLNFDRLSCGKDKIVIALSHYYNQGGDMVADPDMEIAIYPETQMAEALTYQDSFGYQVVYQGESYYPALKKQLNAFLSKWLTNLKQQGFSFTA